jgi:hypothetical protein
MYPSNVKEYLVEKVISYVKERDEEIELLNSKISKLEEEIENSRCYGCKDGTSSLEGCGCQRCLHLFCDHCISYKGKVLGINGWNCDECVKELLLLK